MKYLQPAAGAGQGLRPMSVGGQHGVVSEAAAAPSGQVLTNAANATQTSIPYSPGEEGWDGLRQGKRLGTATCCSGATLRVQGTMHSGKLQGTARPSCFAINMLQAPATTETPAASDLK